MRFGILLCLVLGAAVPHEARACGCGDNRSWNEVARSDALFIGQLVEIELEYVIAGAPWLDVPEALLSELQPNHVKLVFEVERWWKGSGHHRIEVFTDRSSCALEVPSVGSTMLIEANEYRGSLFTFLCLRSLPIYRGGEVQHMASNPAYANYRLLTRDSLYVHLGSGHEPSRVRHWWLMLALLGLIGFVIWWQKSKAA
jgi:hypothetical protein